MSVTTFRRLCPALLTCALLLPASAAADGVQIISSDTREVDAGAPVGGGASSAATRKITPCTWSYFGDPRSIAHDEWIHTGCIGTDGKAKLDQFNVDTGEHRLLTLFRGLEVDDHNNPSLIFFRRKMYAFASPHAGYVYPRDRDPFMAYRVSRSNWAEGVKWAGTRTIPLGQGCGLGYTYPNPVVSGKRMYLFMRGPCWYPYFTWTKDGTSWKRPRTLVLGPPSAGRNVRPYAKYDTAPDGSILMTFSDGHPGSYENNLYYMRFKGGRFYKADGTRIGTTADLPFRLSELDMVQRHSAAKGRAWPMDIAWSGDGAPRIVYSSRIGDDDVFKYARFDGRRWVKSDVAPAGGSLFGYRNGGITFDHSDPDWVVLTRLIDGAHEIEVRHTPDRGRSWEATQLTTGSRVLNFRPVFPRGFDEPDERVVVYVSGSASSFRSYRTVVKMRIDRASAEPAPSPPPGLPDATPTPDPGTGTGGGTPAP
jgi:hypothetical protein